MLNELVLHYSIFPLTWCNKSVSKTKYQTHATFNYHLSVLSSNLLLLLLQSPKIFLDPHRKIHRLYIYIDFKWIQIYVAICLSKAWDYITIKTSEQFEMSWYSIIWNSFLKKNCQTIWSNSNVSGQVISFCIQFKFKNIRLIWNQLRIFQWIKNEREKENGDMKRWGGGICRDRWLLHQSSGRW